MTEKNKEKLGNGLIILLITVCFTVCLMPALSAAAGPGDAMPGPKAFGKPHQRTALGIWRNPQLVEKLQLDESQVRQLKNADFAFRAETLALKAQHADLRLQMEKAFSADAVDPSAVRGIAKKIADIDGRLLLGKVESRLTLGKILTADQLQTLKSQCMRPENRMAQPNKKHVFGHRQMHGPDTGMLF